MTARPMRRLLGTATACGLALAGGATVPSLATSAPAPQITRAAVSFGPLRSSATLTVCAPAGALRIQRTSWLEALDDPSVVYGRDSGTSRRVQSTRCQAHRVSWVRTPRMSGSGNEFVRFVVLDASGRRSNAVQRRNRRSD